MKCLGGPETPNIIMLLSILVIFRPRASPKLGLKVLLVEETVEGTSHTSRHFGAANRDHQRVQEALRGLKQTCNATQALKPEISQKLHLPPDRGQGHMFPARSAGSLTPALTRQGGGNS